MRSKILGPVRVLDGNHSLDISAGKLEIILVLLLGNANCAVSISQIIKEVWGQNIPRRAVATVYVYISQLRKIFGQLGGFQDRIVTGPQGYLLRGAGDVLDVEVFNRCVSEGRAHAMEQRYDSAARMFEQALRYWDGPLSWGGDCGSNVETFASYLTETRMESIEMLIEAQLELGLHRELVGRLYTLAAEHPLRETFSRQLMLALYRSDRQGDALGVYQAVRRTLREELGIEPCRSIQQLHRKILRADQQILEITITGNSR